MGRLPKRRMRRVGSMHGLHCWQRMYGFVDFPGVI
jgi:hypothetical protein